MDFSLSEDQRLIRDTVRQFMETEMGPGLFRLGPVGGWAA
jgi:alkylation response protein AidB-like acyl-CoA dehydrogenase